METKNKDVTKTFDAIKVMRQIRDKLSLEIMNMTFEEERAYLDKLRKMFDMLEQKSVLMQLLDVSSHADGIQIFIGGESDLLPYEDLAVISAPYSVDGQIVGTLGVIGPTRMAYDRVIPIVDITSKLLSGALSS